jgi:hypothetical protein
VKTSVIKIRCLCVGLNSRAAATAKAPSGAKLNAYPAKLVLSINTKLMTSR